MTRREIIDLVQRQGGYVSLEYAGEGRPLAVFSPHIGFDARCSMQSWEYSLLLVPDASGWTIEFGQAAATRPLTTQELRTVLASWLNTPVMDLFAPYRREP